MTQVMEIQGSVGVTNPGCLPVLCCGEVTGLPHTPAGGHFQLFKHRSGLFSQFHDEFQFRPMTSLPDQLFEEQTGATTPGVGEWQTQDTILKVEWIAFVY